MYGMQTETYTSSHKDSLTVINATTVIGQGFGSQVASYTYTDLPGSSSEGVKCLTSFVLVLKLLYRFKSSVESSGNN